MASKRCDNINENERGDTNDDGTNGPPDGKGIPEEHDKAQPELEEEPLVGDVTGAVMRHLAAHGRRMATA